MANANDFAGRLPYFYAEKEHDTITAEDWLNRAMALQQSANWPPVKAVNECRLALRGIALEWYMGLAFDQAVLQGYLIYLLRHSKKSPRSPTNQRI